MPMPRPRLAVVYLRAILCLGVFPAGAGAASSLIEKSPFLPPDFQAPGSASAAVNELPSTTIGHLSFRGVFQIGGEYRFNIHDGQTNQGGWFSQGDPNAPFQVLSYDPQDRSIAVEINGETGRISLQRPTDDPVAVSSGSQPQARPAQPPGQRRVVVPPRRTMRPLPAGARPAPRTPPPPPRPRSR